jgi:signal transduction histidine kinase
VGAGIRNMGPGRPEEILLRELETERAAQYEAAKNRIVNRLVLTNIIILVGGGLLCYYLAKRTLTPIEEAHEAQNRFTADASHELRTPIAVMQSEIEVALMNPKLNLKTAKDILKSNLEELAKLTALSEGLLSLAKVQHGKLEVSKIKAHSVVQLALAAVLPLANNKHISIKNQVDTSVNVLAHESTLKEAVIILLDNAIKYSPDRTEIIVDSIQKHQTVVINIKDQGVGIKASDLVHIFDRFYRTDTSRSKDAVSGYGIGLAIAKNIIDLHSGEISVSSTPGKGSTFSFSLPAA